MAPGSLAEPAVLAAGQSPLRTPFVLDEAGVRLPATRVPRRAQHKDVPRSAPATTAALSPGRRWPRSHTSRHRFLRLRGRLSLISKEDFPLFVTFTALDGRWLNARLLVFDDMHVRPWRSTSGSALRTETTPGLRLHDPSFRQTQADQVGVSRSPGER